MVLFESSLLREKAEPLGFEVSQVSKSKPGAPRFVGPEAEILTTDHWPLPLRLADHDFCGLDEGEGGFAGFEGEFADGVGGDDGGDSLAADRKHDLGEQAFDHDFDDGAGELVAAADARGAGVGSGGGHELIQSIQGDAMVAAGGLDGADAAGEDPVLERGIADAESGSGLSWCEQCGVHVEVKEPHGVLYTAATRLPVSVKHPVIAITRQGRVRMLHFAWLFPRYE